MQALSLCIQIEFDMLMLPALLFGWIFCYLKYASSVKTVSYSLTNIFKSTFVQGLFCFVYKQGRDRAAAQHSFSRSASAGMQGGSPGDCNSVVPQGGRRV